MIGIVDEEVEVDVKNDNGRCQLFFLCLVCVDTHLIFKTALALETNSGGYSKIDKNHKNLP